jgi:hypothetical protein
MAVYTSGRSTVCAHTAVCVHRCTGSKLRSTTVDSGYLSTDYYYIYHGIGTKFSTMLARIWNLQKTEFLNFIMYPFMCLYFGAGLPQDARWRCARVYVSAASASNYTYA